MLLNRKKSFSEQTEKLFLLQIRNCNKLINLFTIKNKRGKVKNR